MRLLALALVLLAAPVVARADDLAEGGPPGMAPPGMAPPGMAPYATPASPPPRVTQEISYSHQTLASDGVAAVLIAAGALQRDPYAGILLVSLGADVYALGAPIVHLANRRGLNSLKSLGVRFGLPMVGAVIGGVIGPRDAIECEPGASCDDSEPSTLGLIAGAGLGAIAAVAIDARYFARKRVTVAAPAVVPSIGYGPAGLHVGIGGSF